MYRSLVYVIGANYLLALAFHKGRGVSKFGVCYRSQLSPGIGIPQGVGCIEVWCML